MSQNSGDGGFSFYPHRLDLPSAYLAGRSSSNSSGSNELIGCNQRHSAAGLSNTEDATNVPKILAAPFFPAHILQSPTSIRSELQRERVSGNRRISNGEAVIQMHVPHPPESPKPVLVSSSARTSAGAPSRSSSPRARLPPITRSNSTSSISSSCSNASGGSLLSSRVGALPPLQHNGSRAPLNNIATSNEKRSLDNYSLSSTETADQSAQLISFYQNHLTAMQNEDSPEGSADSRQLNNAMDADNISTSSSSSLDGEEDFSVSSMSDEPESDAVHNLTVSKGNTLTMGNASGTFQLLYSTPFKDKHRIPTQNVDGNSTFVSTYNFMPLSLGGEVGSTGVLDGPLHARSLTRTLSDPTLHKEKLDVIARAQILSPAQPRHSAKSEERANSILNRKLPEPPNNIEDTLVESSGSYESIDHGDAVRKKKVSFKTLAKITRNMLPRLPTEGARSRAVDKAISDLEIYLPDRKLRVYVGTWNMKGTKVIPDNLEDLLLPPESDFLQDVYIIGSQEGTPLRREWEIRLQENLGPAHVMMHSACFGVLYLVIFVRRELVWFCTGVEQATIATRLGHQIKTKGALAVAFNVFGTSFLIINSHFTSNEEKVRERLNDYRTICKSLQLPSGGPEEGDSGDVTLRYDQVFWMGDFNFRVAQPREEVDELLTKNYSKERKIAVLMKSDQLRQLFEGRKIFHGFTEAAIKFMPTYKFDVNTNQYDTSSKQRVPSWTDRILFKSKATNQIISLCYNSCPIVQGSDHRPVYGMFETSIAPNTSRVMPAGAQFDRSVYIEANLRRAAPQGSQSASSVCVIL